MRRRRFLRTLAMGAAGTALVPRALRAGEDEIRLVILHTNDTHSRMDPFPMDGGRFQGLGGVARRAALIERIRREHRHVLLLDSGDIFQGTPYFNLFGGEVELRAMSAMGYDVATLGNHDFDNGVGGLTAMLPHADFEIVSANYDVSDPDLAARVRPWTIREIEGMKVGIFGLGIDFENLVLPSLHEGVTYRDPILAAGSVAEELRNRGCDLVICLSHLGYRYREDRPSDTALAQEVAEIDLILGGHTHTFMDEPDVYRTGETGFCVVHQVGWAGMRLGRIDVTMTRGGPPSGWSAVGYPVDARLDRLA